MIKENAKSSEWNVNNFLESSERSKNFNVFFIGFLHVSRTLKKNDTFIENREECQRNEECCKGVREMGGRRERKIKRLTKGKKAEKDQKKNQNLLNNLIIYFEGREREREKNSFTLRLFEVLSLLVQDDV